MKFVDFFLNVQRITETAFGLSLAIANTLLSTIQLGGLWDIFTEGKSG